LALQPPVTARVLPLGSDQHDACRAQPRLLPEEAVSRRHPQPSRHLPGPPPHRRPMGTAARKPDVDRGTPTTGSGGLTTPLRFLMSGHGTIGDLGRALADVDHVLDPAATLVSTAMRFTHGPSGAQTAMQFAA